MKFRYVLCLAGACLVSFACQQSTSPQITIQESRAQIRSEWSRDGTTIAFEAVLNQVPGLYLVDTSGTNVRLLHASSNLRGCSWSPDSRSLVYSDSGSLYRISVQGDTISQLTTSGSDYRPAWSFDGEKILFLRNSDVYMLNLVTDSVADIVSGADFPTWHNSGQFVSLQYAYAGGGYYSYYFLAVEPDSTFGSYIYSFYDYGDCHYVDVDPVGVSITQLAYAFRPFDGYTQIWIADVASQAVYQLTDDGGDYPSYSPDGKRIVYTRTLSGDGGLWIINADGTGKHRLLNP